MPTIYEEISIENGEFTDEREVMFKSWEELFRKDTENMPEVNLVHRALTKDQFTSL